MVDLFQINCCYELTNFKVTFENQKYPSGSGNQLQVILVGNYEIRELDDDGVFGDLPKIAFNFTALNVMDQVANMVPIGNLSLVDCPIEKLSENLNNNVYYLQIQLVSSLKTVGLKLRQMVLENVTSLLQTNPKKRFVYHSSAGIHKL